jgi:PAS domain S-box-containing protein
MQKKELKKSIEDFSNAIEQGCGAVYRRNFDSVVYEYMGGYIEEITGYAAEELTPEIWDSLIVETEQRDELAGLSLDEANQLVRSGQVERWKADVLIKTRSGEKRWVTDMSTVLRDESGACYGCLGVLLDITDRKEAEKELADLTEKLRIRNQEMDAELAMAREVQQALVSDQPVRFPWDAANTQSRVDFYHRYIPAEMLAGDFFDILPLSDHEVGVFICDVVGHGVRAALLTTFLRGLIEELVPYAHDPGVFLSKINHGLSTVFGHGETFLFASAFYLVLDLSSGHIRYSNAGHPHPMLLQPENKLIARLADQKGEAGPALGIVEDFKFASLTHQLSCAESIFLYTDGLFEVYNSHEEMYGEMRVEETLRKYMMLHSDEQMDRLTSDILKFAGADLFEDDVCLLAVVPSILETNPNKGE